MKQVYITQCTEYEAGWGQRPDGIVLCEDLEKLKAYAKEHSTGSPEYFWRYSDPKALFVEEKVWEELISNKDSENGKKGIVCLDRLPEEGFYLKA